MADLNIPNIIPWESSVFPNAISSELDRRKLNRGVNYINNKSGDWTNNDGDWSNYKGPLSPFVRFCSNGAGRQEFKYYDKNNRQGFVLFGGKDFYSGYGFKRNTQGNTNSIIGYMPDGTPHVIDNDIRTSNYPINVPPPEIERINVVIQKELFRRAIIEWVCFSPTQLAYMTPYFLTPGITCILEWGWNHFNPTSLLDLTNTTELKRLYIFPYSLYTDNILKSNGNYDVLFGRIDHFEWSIDGTKIRCKTQVTSKDRIYAGISVNSSIIDNQNKNDKEKDYIEILDTLKTFVEKSLPNIRTVSTNNIQNLDPEILNFISYIQREYPKETYGNRADELIYGIFFGRDFSSNNNDIGKYASDDDFDKNGSEDTWINMGLLIEILNYHTQHLKDFDNNPTFKVDIDDCVISGHPNMISTNGNYVLIPNSESPKYFFGLYGQRTLSKENSFVNDAYNRPYEDPVYTTEYDKKLKVSDIKRTFGSKDLTQIKDLGLLPDWKLTRVLRSGNVSYRDDLDVVINQLRYEKCGKKQSFAFPFKFDQSSGINGVSEEYPRRYSGYLKNIYFNIKELNNIIGETSTKTFSHVLTKVLERISTSVGNFWDFRLVSGTGKINDSTKKEAATMKIVDYRFTRSINNGKVYTFDYFDADSLLQGIKFTPTISNSQAIRTIYAETANSDRTVILNDTNELLDGQFKDRLFLDETKKTNTSGVKTTNTFKQLMTSLQGLKPINIGNRSSCQMTLKRSNGDVIIKRLVMPDDEIIKLFLDDGDEENNPKYTGIMPGIQAQFTIQGIGGLRTFMMFLVKNLPEPYSHKNIVFRIIDLSESIESGKWVTVITAGVIPLRNHIKRRLGITGEF